MGHRTYLPLEREVVDVLVEGDLGGEAQRIAPAVDGALRPGRGVDGGAALADVLLPLDLGDHVLDVHDIDQLRRLELPVHRLEPAAAIGAGAVRIVERATHRNAIKPKLLRRAMATSRFPGRWRLTAGLGPMGLGRGSSGRLDRITEGSGLFACGLDQRERALQLAPVRPLELVQLRALLRVDRDEVLQLRLL